MAADRGGALGVVLVDSLHANRAAFRVYLDGAPGLRVVGDAASADEALSMLRRIRRGDGGVVLACMNLPAPHDVMWLIRAVRTRFPDVRILACGAGPGPVRVSGALFMGADGFVDKGVEPAVFLEAIRRAGRGELVIEGLPLDGLGRVVEALDRRAAAPPALTERERAVLTVAAEGLTARQIASRLDLAEGTVTTHLSRIYRKLGVGSRVGALAAAMESGLLTIAAGE